MSDRVKLAREIAARTEARFIEIKPEPRTKLPLSVNKRDLPPSYFRGGSC
ncbi:MAG: hypothetical protein ACRD3W_29175 [Terriglobales bacterium]